MSSTDTIPDSMEAALASWTPPTPEQRAAAAAKRVTELAEHAANRRRKWRLRCTWEASKTASHAAKARRSTIVQHLRSMAKVGLSLGEMARQLEAAEVLTPRGNRRWTTQQVKMTLRHALKYQPAALRASYKIDVAKSVKVPKELSGSKMGAPRKIKAKPPGNGGYAKPNLRRRSKITKRPGV